MGHDKRRVIVWGAGGHGKVIVDALLACGCWDVAGLLDDDEKKVGKKVLGVPVRGMSARLAELADELKAGAIAIAIGDNYVRDEKFRKAKECALSPVTIIHPSAHMSRFVELGEGVAILAGATVNPGTMIEDNVCVNTAASIDHDNYLARGCHIYPNATLAGGVRVGEFAYVGSGAVVTPNVVVHKYSYVGAGAVAVKDVREGVIVTGVPATEIGPQLKRPK
jgi:sugar O-acyltransferase (sialic acid O-acetyltransferase NeuD family)